MKGCYLCARECGVNRSEHLGFCGIGDELLVARAALHNYEEPCISGKNGSGTVFFSGCNLHCSFCQNYEISTFNKGKAITVNRLADIFKELEAAGAHNINLVTPTIYSDKIIKAIELSSVNIPFVYNCGGYESEAVIKRLCDYIDVFMPDVKFFSPSLSARYCRAADYYKKALSALKVMCSEKGKPIFSDDGMLLKGVLVRHLVMPGQYKDSMDIIQNLYDEFGNESFVLSLMSQYVPPENLQGFPEINRRVTTFEYQKVAHLAEELRFNGYTQERGSASEKYLPLFDFTGV